MVVENKILKKVKDFGLNSYEAKIWTALLSRGVSTAGEISDIANVPRSRSYDVLESLEKKGFILMKIGKPIQYIAVSPEEVLERVKKNIRQEAEEKVDVLRDFENSNLLDELNQLHNEGIEAVDPTDITGFVKGREHVYDHMNMMMKNASESIMISTSSEGLNRIEENLTRALNKTDRNGVSIRIISPATNELSQRENVELRKARVSNRFMIVDGTKVLFFITDEETHKNYDTAVWIESPVVASMLEENFNNSWSPVNVKTSLKAEVKKKA